MSMSSMLGKLIMAGMVAKGVSMAGGKSGSAGGGGIAGALGGLLGGNKSGCGVLAVAVLPTYWVG